jgi:ABC-type glycerol-3-phosphate transport system substrate-binding protein
MKRATLSRREFLRLAALTGGGMIAAACQPVTPPAAPAAAPAAPAAAEQPTKPAAAPAAASSTEVIVWYQSWPASDAVLKRVQPLFESSHENAKLNIQGLTYEDLNNKFLPAIAAGTEGDLNMLYTNWVVATDVTKVLLDITDPVGGWGPIGEKMWPAAFSTMATPANRVYYLPWIAGIRGAAVTVVTTYAQEAGIDYLSFKTYDDVVAAGKKLTQRDASGKLTRSGWSPESAQIMLFLTWIWQQGGEFLDEEQGKWALQTPEAQAAIKLLYDAYWTDKTVDFNVWNSEFEAQGQGKVAICAQGAWSAASVTDANKVPSDNIVTPPLVGAKNKTMYPDHIACWGLSRRLANDSSKLKAALDLGLLLTGPQGLIDTFQDYSGVCMSKEVYQDPRIDKVKYGPMSKRIAEGMWPNARYPKTYVANLGLMSDAMTRGLKKEITLDAALAEMEKVLQTEEDATRKKLKG